MRRKNRLFGGFSVTMVVAWGLVWSSDRILAEPVVPTLVPGLTRPVDQSRFRVTTFAAGLANPTSMTELADGSILVATSAGGNSWISNYIFASSASALVRLADTDGDGVADQTAVLASTGLPGLTTSVRRCGNLVFALSSQGGKEAITVWRTGAGPADPLTQVGKLGFSFPSGWAHSTYALAARPAAGGGIEVYFNVGAQANNVATDPSKTVGLTASAGASFSNATGTVAMAADSIQRVVITDGGASLSVTAPTTIATGLRNAAGMTFDTAGSLWFQDNGIDTPGNGAVSLSADTLHVIAAADLGTTIPNFGFAATYVDYATGAIVGPTAGVTLPVADFRPVNGEKSEGAVEIAFAPASFPSDFAGGVFVPFSGEFNKGGVNNTENPVSWANVVTGSSFHFIENQIMGHPNGVLSTSDALYLSDLNFTGAFGGVVTGTFQGTSVVGLPADRGGVIYRITAVPEPSSLVFVATAAAAWFVAGRKRAGRWWGRGRMR